MRALKRRVLGAGFRASVRPTDVFLVTYPRSGTTWAGFLVASALHPSERFDIKSYLRHLPDVNELYFGFRSLRDHSALPDPRVFSVHAPYDPALARVIYVLRDPRDVMVSYWHFQRLTEASFQLGLREFVQRDDHWPCRWDEHVAGWLLDHRPRDMLVVRYEDLQRDPAKALREMLEFARLPARAEDVERAVAAGGFENMQRGESRSGFSMDGAAPLRGESFVRRGKVGGWQDELDAEALACLEAKYGEVMRKVGYEPGSA